MTALPPEAAHYVDEWLGRGWEAKPLAGDASVRAYYRIAAPDGKSYILAYYPQEVRAQLARFLSSYETVSPHGRVPAVVRHCDVAVLQDDVGDRTLFAVLHDDREEGIRLYHAALDLLAGFQKAGETNINAPFTADFFYGELEMAREFYVGKLMDGDGAALESIMKTICESVARHPYVLCHRDFHGQNLHIENDTLYLIDYQDLRMGPDMYDLASLLRDRGVARIIGDEAELALLAHYVEVTGAQGDVRRRYFETLLQRSIKILGTFAKQPIVRGRMHYLEFIPPTLESIRRCIDELPEYAALRDMFPLQFDLETARKRAQDLNRE
ncbi:MAG TPA: phosphotransferase [Thermoanaerobaculia bacterium]|nr:phosphotransferase [Thermoanaerobaculia bacterium]